MEADGGTRSPVRGLIRQPCAASTSWSQPAAACATASGPLSAAATPAISTETSDGSECRFPRPLRTSVSRPSSTAARTPDQALPRQGGNGGCSRAVKAVPGDGFAV